MFLLVDTLIITWRTLAVWFWAYFYFALKNYPRNIYFNSALVLPLILGYADLTSRERDYERKLLFKTCALILFQDYLLDESEIDPAILVSLFDNPETFNSEHPSLHAIKNLAVNVKQNIPPRHWELIKRLNESQIDSEKTNEFDNYLKFSRLKGLWYTVCALVINPSMEDSEIEYLSEIGYWLKCVDDSVDLEEDLSKQKNSVYSHPSTYLNPTSHLILLEKNIINQMAKLHYPEYKIKVFIRRLALASATFRFHTEFANHSPNWYKKLLHESSTILIFNLFLASLLKLGNLQDIQNRAIQSYQYSRLTD